MEGQPLPSPRSDIRQATTTSSVFICLALSTMLAIQNPAQATGPSIQSEFTSLLVGLEPFQQPATGFVDAGYDGMNDTPSEFNQDFSTSYNVHSDSVEPKPITEPGDPFAALNQTADFEMPQLIDLRTAIPCLVLVAIAGAVATILLNNKNRCLAKPGCSAQLNVIDKLALNRTSALYLVQTGDDRYLVATDPSGIKSVLIAPGWESPTSDLENIAETVTSSAVEAPVRPFPSSFSVKAA